MWNALSYCNSAAKSPLEANSRSVSRSMGGKLLLVLTSTVVLGFQHVGTPWPYFLFFQTFTCFEMGAFFSTRGGVSTTGHSSSTGEWLPAGSVTLTHWSLGSSVSEEIRFLLSDLKVQTVRTKAHHRTQSWACRVKPNGSDAMVRCSEICLLIRYFPSSWRFGNKMVHSSHVRSRMRRKGRSRTRRGRRNRSTSVHNMRFVIFVYDSSQFQVEYICTEGFVIFINHLHPHFRLSNFNNKFWEVLTYFLLTRHGPHRKRKNWRGTHTRTTARCLATMGAWGHTGSKEISYAPQQKLREGGGAQQIILENIPNKD
jgi:hypothetical protein